MVLCGILFFLKLPEIKEEEQETSDGEVKEYTIKDLLEQGAVFDSLGVGDNIAAAKERVGGVYKLVAVEENGKPSPRMKISGNIIKMTNPGFKKVVRFYDKETGYALGDAVALREEEISKEEYTLVHPIATWKQTTLHNYETRELLVPIYLEGKLVYKGQFINNRRASRNLCNII